MFLIKKTDICITRLDMMVNFSRHYMMVNFAGHYMMANITRHDGELCRTLKNIEQMEITILYA